MKGVRGTQESGLPVIHWRVEGGALCTSDRGSVDCARCLRALEHVGRDCAWCGGEIERPSVNGRGEAFCSGAHRSASDRALRRLLNREERIGA